MAENARVVREQKRGLETNMNVSQVDNNIYVHALRCRNIPVTQDKINSMNRPIGANRNLIFPPDTVVYKQTTK